MLTLRATPEGVVVLIQAQPGARKNAVLGEHAGRLKVAVTQAPEKGKANDAILDVLSQALGVKRSQVHLLRGDTSRQKEVLISGLTVEELLARVTALLS
jgi:uncharacterized protein (TIGR00251 family)